MIIEKLINFLDTHNLPWLILALITWVTIYFSCSLKQFLHALPVAIWTMLLGGILEHFFILHKFWIEDFILINVNGLDLFVIIGPFFSLGLILIRFLPRGKWSKYLTVLLFAVLSAMIELLSIKLGFLQFESGKWNIFYSVFAYFVSLMSALGFYYVYYNNDVYKT